MCEERAGQAIMELLRRLQDGDARVVVFDVHLIHLSSGRARIARMLQSLSERLLAAGVHMEKKPRARSTKEVPPQLFENPVVLQLCTPTAMREAIADSVWKTAW